jgi:hypothetical protein
MQIFTPDCFASIDFAADHVQLIRPSAEVLGRQVSVDEMPIDLRMAMKEQMFERLLTVETLTAVGRNAILDEQNDFALSIQTNSSPAVSGEDGAMAVELAARVLDQIAHRKWDGQASRQWRIGAHAMVQPRVIPIRPQEGTDQSDQTRRAG